MLTVNFTSSQFKDLQLINYTKNSNDLFCRDGTYDLSGIILFCWASTLGCTVKIESTVLYCIVLTITHLMRWKRVPGYLLIQLQCSSIKDVIEWFDKRSPGRF